MSFATTELSQNADRQVSNATEIGHSLIFFSEIGGLLEKYGQQDSLAKIKAAHRDELVEKARLLSSAEALRSMVEKMVSGRMGSATADNVAQIYEDKIEELHAKAKRAIDKSDEAKEFHKAVWEVAHPGQPFVESGDDDLAVLAPEEETFKCPLTLKELETPMRNTCGHVYSKDAVLVYIHRYRNRAVCPVAGCNKQLSNNTIKEDTQLSAKIANSKKRKRPETEENVEDL